MKYYFFFIFSIAFLTTSWKFLNSSWQFCINSPKYVVPNYSSFNTSFGIPNKWYSQGKVWAIGRMFKSFPTKIFESSLSKCSEMKSRTVKIISLKVDTVLYTTIKLSEAPFKWPLSKPFELSKWYQNILLSLLTSLLGIAKKSHEAKSGHYGRWSNATAPFLVNNSLIMKALWDGAISSCNKHQHCLWYSGWTR